MDYHPYTEIWPLLTGRQFEDLKADIKTHGQRVDVLTYQGLVLDGRNRVRACETLDIPVRCVEANVKNDSEALDLVASLNTHRRHLTTAERAVAGARVTNIKNGSNRHATRHL